MAGSPLRFVALFFYFGLVGCTGYALYASDWYKVSATSFSAEYGLLRRCWGGVCDLNLTWTGTTWTTATGTCTRTIEEEKGYFYGCLSGALFAGLMGLIGLGLSVPGSKSIGVVIVGLLAFLFSAATLGIFTYFIHYYYFCNTTYCSMLSLTTGCSSFFGIGYWVYVGAAGSGLLGFVLSIVAFVLTPEDESSEESNQNDAEQPPSNRTPNEPYQPEHQDANKAEAEAAPAESSESAGQTVDDWCWDETAGLWWSEAHQLYLHDETHQFYDPVTGLWCKDGVWYQAEE